MQPFWTSNNGETTLTIYHGDVLDVLRQLPDESVHCCITSPPYWGLRDYGVDGQIGLESSPQEYVERLVQVFREVRRVLRTDGTLWLNLGDSYAGSWGNYGAREGKQRSRISERWHRPAYEDPRAGWRGLPPTAKPGPGLKPKDLVGIPWMVAFALRDDGWYLRADIIWAKPNPMPESVTDRPTKAHEYVFLLAKSPRYYYDADAVREPHEATSLERAKYGEAQRKEGVTIPGRDKRWHAKDVELNPLGRNKRSVWTIATEPFPEAHFATFPTALVEPMILAGTSPKACPQCGAPWKRVVEAFGLDESRPQARRALELARQHGLTEAHIAAIRAVGVTDAGKAQVTQTGFGKNDPAVQALADEAKAALGGYYREFLLMRPTKAGFRPTCSCPDNDGSGRCVVLDPFVGSGTTLLVAQRLGRNGIGIDLNRDYCDMARRRLENEHVQMRLPVVG